MKDKRAKREPVAAFFQTSRSRIAVGPKLVVAVILAGLIIVIAFWSSPTNGWAGVGIGVSGVAGVALGVLLQPEPLPKDLSPQAHSAVRGLLEISDAIDNIDRLTNQLAGETTSARISVGLVTVHDDLIAAQVKVFRSMTEWDYVAPGSLDEVKRLEDAGRVALDLLARKESK